MPSGWVWLSVLIVLALAVGLWPNFGLLARGRRWRARRERAWFEDILKHLLNCKHQDQRATPASVAAALNLSPEAVLRLIARMEASGLLQLQEGELHLTTQGEQWALQVVRAHRLWERYLADEAGLPPADVHRLAERAEHHLSAEDLDALDAHLGHPGSDPHGHPIPTASGAVTAPKTFTLTDWPVDRPARIFHVEATSEVILKQIMAEGLRPGKLVDVLENTPERLILSDGEHEYRLAPAVAAAIQVVEAPSERYWPPHDLIRLTELAEGQEKQVAALDPQCRGFTRRRLLDLGMTPGARVRAELSNPLGDTRAFRVRGTLIALRREQAALVWLKP